MDRTTRIRVLVGTAAVALVAAAGGYGLSIMLQSPAERLAEADAPGDSLLTATVRRGALDAPPPVRGKVAWSSTSEVIVPGDGSSRTVVTGLPRPVGSRVWAGQVVVEVGDRPVFLLEGQIPLLRDLSAGDEGPDVIRLQTALRAAGYEVSDDGVFAAATVTAITDIYRRAGYDPPAGTVMVGMSEWVFAPQMPVFVSALPVPLGGDAKGPVARLAARGPVVHAEIAVADRPRMRDQVEVQEGRGSGRRYLGDVSAVGRARNTARGAVVPFTISPRTTLQPALVGKLVNIVDAAGQASQGLLVPIAAVYASDDGSLSVRKLVGGEAEMVEVTMRDTSGGTARVRPATRGELRTGDEVVLGTAP